MANNEATYIFNSKKGLPNKLLQADGTVTDMVGNVVINPDGGWDAKQALPNKWLNPDGTYSTLNEIIASVVDTGIYVVVDELPAEGDPQKIYLVPDSHGGFAEYHWTGTKWDAIGTVEIDLSNYSTTQEMMNAIEAAGLITLNSAKSYADGKANTAEQNAKDYADGLAQNYDPAGTGASEAAGAVTEAENYANDNFLNKTNETAYTPTKNYHPATKKYVDDSIANNITTALQGSY